MFFHESPSFPLSLVGRSAFAVSTHLFVICETGSKGGTVVRALASYQCGPGSNPGVDAICGLSLLLVLSQCSERFFSGYSGFPPSSETMQHFQIPILPGIRRRTTMWMCYLQIVIYLFILFISSVWQFIGGRGSARTDKPFIPCILWWL